MITISNLSKNYGKRTLFENISLTINRGEKIGLVGPNGSGKTTLFSIILGDTESSSGNVQLNKNIRIGYLPQESKFHSQNTVLSELIKGDDEIIRLRKEKSQLEEDNQAASNQYADILHKLETLGVFELEYKAKKILMGLGFKEDDFNRPINQMSGGWQMRTLLAKLLTYDYDLLLLDEPTNYLDLNAALWLKDFLTSFKGTFIMISHDKAFLDEVANYTLILENASIFKVKGNYEHFEQIKNEKRGYLIKQYKEQEKKRKQLEDFIARFHAQPNKAASVRAKRTELSRMNEIIIPPDVRDSIREFSFPATRRSGYRVMNLKKISKAYGDIQVYKDFDFEITQNESAVLAGENGAGKSTLLKILAGAIPIDSGERVAGHNVDVGYFSQTRLDVLSPSNTVLEEAYTVAAGKMNQESIRTILAAFLFVGDDIYKTVSVLSGGEKSRLILAKLLISPPNFLLLDEPTTHLDVDAVEALIRALKQYGGTIVFISHDIHFVRSLANTVFEVKDGRVRKFSGGLDYYLEKKQEGEVNIIKDKPSRRPHPEDKERQEARQKELLKRQEEALLKKEKQARKAHNAKIHNEISGLSNKKEKLRIESIAKARLLSDPDIVRNAQTAKEYGRRIKDIDKESALIDEDIVKLKEKLIQ